MQSEVTNQNLIRVTVTNAVKVEYAYDGFGRRRIRQEYRWSAGGWTNTSETRYVYDGMAVLQERDGNNHPLVTYTRGLDLSGTSQGAGGIGGLLARSDTNGHAFYHADGNGNITMLINAEGTKLAQYLYDSFAIRWACGAPSPLPTPIDSPARKSIAAPASTTSATATTNQTSSAG